MRAMAELGPGWVLLLLANVTLALLPNLPGLEGVRGVGMALYPALVLWGAGCFLMWREWKRSEPKEGGVEKLPAAA
jgi:hypothetical protein